MAGSSLDLLNVTSKPHYDDLLTSYRYIAHYPLASSTYSHNDEIRFQVENQNEFWLPSQSYIIIEGILRRAPAASAAVLIENGILHAFNECRYLINGIEVDETRGLGIATAMKGMCSITSEELGQLDSAGWGEYGDLHSRQAGNHFSICVPLKLILGFAEDYQKVLLGVRQELVFVRSRSDVNCFISPTENDTSELDITKMTWMMPSVGVSDKARISLLNIMQKNTPLVIPFRSWSYHENPSIPAGERDFTWTITSKSHLETPRYIIVTFQSGRKNRTAESLNHFDHASVSNIKIFLNSEVFPYGNMNLDFASDKYATAYKMYVDFQKTYYGRGNKTPRVSFAEFKTSRTIFVIDCSTRDERLKIASTDIRLEAQMSAVIAPHTSCNCLVIHDRLVEYRPLSNNVRKM